MPDQDEALEVLPANDVHHVGDVGVERDHAAHEMRALAEPGERRREHLVTAPLQQVGDAAIAPATGRGAVHQHERLALGLRLRRCRRCGDGGARKPGADSADRCPASPRMLRHPVLQIM
jgi:hypothetical protein